MRWRGLLERARRDRRLSRVPLAGLPEAAVARFFPPDATVGARALHELHERTAGNPFFLRELVRLLAERGELAGDGATLPALVPERVREVVGRRLEPLEPATREVLAIAGVVGRPFTIAGVARIGGLGRESVAQALQPALSGRLLEPRPDAPGRFGFAHAIVRDAVYDELAAGAARAAARVAAGAAAGVARSRRRRDRRRGGPSRAGGGPLRRRPAAGLGPVARGGARGGGAAGARGGRRALRGRAGGARARRGGDGAVRLETSLALAAATFAAGDIDAAPAALPQRRDGRPAQRRRRDPRPRGARLLRGAAVRLDRHDAIALLQEALDSLPPHDSALRARALRAARPAARPRHRPGAARGAVDEGVAMARRLGDDDALVSLLAAAALVNWPPDATPPAARDRGGARARGARRRPGGGLLGAHDPAARALKTGQLDVVDAELDHLARLSAESRRTYYRWCLLVLQAARATFAGRLAEGERLAEEAAQLNRRHGAADQEHTVQRLALALQRRRPRGGAARRAARLRGAPPGPAGMAGDARAGGVEPGPADEARAATAAACARDGFAAILPTPDWLCGLSSSPSRWPLGHAGADRSAGRGARRRTPGATWSWTTRGPRSARSRGRWAARAPPAARGGAAAHFEHAVELAARWGAPGWELAAIADWLASGASPARSDALRDRGLALARDLDLPWIAASLGQTTMP